MADTVTDRVKAVSASGNFSGLSHIFVNTFGGMAPPRWEQNLLTIQISFLGAYIQFRTMPALDAAFDPIPPTRELQLFAYTGVGIGNGTGDTDSVTHDFDTATPATLDWQEALSSGTWSISMASMQEILRDTDTGNYPTYGGTQIFDPPREKRAEFIDLTKDGNLLTVEATIAGMSVSASAALTGTALRYEKEYALTIQMWGEGRGKAVTDFGCSNIVINLGGNNATLSGSLAYTDAYHSISASGTDGKVTVSANAAGKKTYGSAVFYPDKEADVKFALRAMEQSYPFSVNIRADLKRTQTNQLLTIADGSTLSISQKKHSLSGAFYEIAGGGFTSDLVGQATPSESDPTLRPTTLTADQPPSVILDEFYPFRCWIDKDWITNNGEQTDDWRTLIRGKPFASFIMEQDASKTVTSTAASATGTSDLTINLPTGTTHAALLGTSFAGVSLRGYRYLRINAKASAPETVTVTIGTKTWTLNLTTSYTDYDIDLCSPDNATAETDTTDTHYPLPTTDGEYWGISSATSIVISDISGGVTVDVANATLRRNSYSRATFLQPFPQEWVSAGDNSEYVPRIIDGDTDGRRSREDIHFYRTPVGADIVYFIRTLSQLIDSIDTGSGGAFPTDGWNATAETVFDDTYHDNDLPACFVWGAGALYSGSAWSYGFDQNAAATLEVQAQALWDSVDFPAWWGDGFWYNDNGFSGPGQIAVAKIFRGQAVGLVFGSDGEPEQGVTVAIEDGSEGVTVTDGSYQTGLPNPKGGTTQSVTAQAGQQPSADVTFPARKRKRACFRVTNNPSGTGFIYNDWHDQTHLSIISAEGLRYYRANMSLPIPGWAVNGVLVTEDAEGRAPMCLDWRERIVMVYEFGGDTYETTSDDDGATWSTPAMAIAGGTLPFVIADESGNLLEAAYISGNIWGRFRASGDTAWSDLFTFDDNGGNPLAVENESFSLTPAHDTPGRYLLAVRLSGESDTGIHWTADEGRTWTELS